MLRPLLSITALALAVPVFAATDNAASFDDSSSMLPSFGTLRAGIQFAGESTDGDFAVLVPMHSTLGKGGIVGGTLVFAEPYAQWAERGATQAGLGVGFRHLFSGQSVNDITTAHSGFMDEGIYIGANASLDMVDARGGRWWQLGLGAEVGTRYLELRGRYHLPLDEGEDTRIHRVTNIDSTFNGMVGDTRFIGQSHVNVDSVFHFLTESLRGWEVEMVGLVPGIDRWVDLRIIGGYAKFESTHFDPVNYDTWKVGAEFRPVPAVVLSATYFDNRRIVGDNWLFGVGVEIPLDTKGGLWSSIKNAFKPRRRHLSERLLEPTRANATPMQLATNLSSAQTRIRYHNRLAAILPDGTVVTVSEGSGTASSSLTISGSTLQLASTNSSVTRTASGTHTSSTSNSYTGSTSIVEAGNLTFSSSAATLSGANQLTGTTRTVVTSSTTVDNGNLGFSSSGLIVSNEGFASSANLVLTTPAAFSGPITITSGNTVLGSNTLLPANAIINLGAGASTTGTLILVGPQGQKVYGNADYLTTFGPTYQSLLNNGYTVPVTPPAP